MASPVFVVILGIAGFYVFLSVYFLFRILSGLIFNRRSREA